MRDRIADEDADGSVDKSVVNWLMQVISGKPPVELGISDALAKAAEVVESGPHMLALSDEEQEKALARDLALKITAEDLCGAPLFTVAAEAEQPKNGIFSQDLSSNFEDADATPEQNGAGQVRRMTGPQLVGGSKVTVATTSRATEVVADVFREGVYFEHTPMATTSTVEESVQIPKPQPNEKAADDVSVLEIVRDPEQYDGNARASMAVADEVDWVPTETPAAEGETARDPFAGVEVAEPQDGHDLTAWNSFVAEAVPEVVTAEPEVTEAAALEVGVAEPEVLAEPEIADEPVVQAEPAVVEEEIPAIPEVAAKVDAGAVVEANAKVATPEPSVEREPAMSGFEAIWTAAAAQRDAKDGRFSLTEYSRELPLSQLAMEAAVAGGAKGMESKPESLKPENLRPENLATALNTLAQLGSVLPLAARMAPMFEGSGGGEPAVGSNAEVRQEVSGLRLLQYEIKTTVQDHSSHLRRLEEQLTHIRESVEVDSSENSAVMEDMKSTAKLVRVMGIGLGFMLMVLILMVAVMLVHGH